MERAKVLGKLLDLYRKSIQPIRLGIRGTILLLVLCSAIGEMTVFPLSIILASHRAVGPSSDMTSILLNYWFRRYPIRKRLLSAIQLRQVHD
jgi:hypothetical protein